MPYVLEQYFLDLAICLYHLNYNLLSVFTPTLLQSSPSSKDNPLKISAMALHFAQSKSQSLYIVV